MRILFCVRIPSHLAVTKKPTEVIPATQFHALWLKAFKSLKWKVTVFRYSDVIILPKKWIATIENSLDQHFPRFFAKWRRLLSIIYDINPLNYLRSTKLLHLILTSKPDTIFLTKGVSELVSFPFLLAKKRRIPIVFFSGENPYVAATPFEREHVRRFDLVIINDPHHIQGWKHFGAKKVVALPYAAIEPSVHKKIAKTKQDIDVVFIGTLTRSRQNDLLYLVKQHLQPTIYGYIPHEIKLHPQLQALYQGEAWPQDTARIYNRAKIALNLIDSSMPAGGNLRTFEIAGCGTFQLAERCPKQWFMPGKEIVLFKNQPEMVRKIKYYLSHTKARQKIAAAGYKRAHRDHTYQTRFQTIQKLLG